MGAGGMTQEPRALGKPYDASADQALPGMPEPPPPTLAERLAAVDAAPQTESAPTHEWDPAGPVPMARIDITGEGEASRSLRRALRRGVLPDVYVQHGHLVEVSVATTAPITRRIVRRGRHLAVREIEAAALRRLLADHTFCYRVKPVKPPKGSPPDAPVTFAETEALPGAQTCRDVLSATVWDGVPPLAGVSTSPVLRPDGSLVQDPGYDEATGVYYSPTLDVGRIPDRPDEDGVERARRFVLEDVLGNFPWVDKADRANYVALLVTPLLRWYTGALAPLGAISAATAGTGKTLLAGDIPQALYGLTSRPWVASDEELRKSISTVLLHSTAPVVLFDNVPEWESVKSPTLAKLLTSEQWDDRALGGNEGIEVENDRLWMATGNSMTFGGDMPSRTVLVRLDAKMARPDLRPADDFKIPDLQSWLKEPGNAAALLRALLIMVADWVAAGARQGLYTKRQFTRWATAAGGFLAHHDVHGFLMNESALDQADDEMTQWLGFAHEWHTHFGDAWKSTTEVHADATNFGFNSTGGINDPWHGHFLTDGNGRPVTAVGLGKRLGGKIDRIFGSDADGYRIERLTNSRTGQNKYRVVLASTVTGVTGPDVEDAPAGAVEEQQGSLFDTGGSGATP